MSRTTPTWAPKPYVPSPARLEYEERAARLPKRRLELAPRDAKLVLAHVVVAFLSLLLGGIAGLLQSLQHTGRIDMPWGLGYYQLLTAHGILMAIVFTTFFIIGFLIAGLATVLGGQLTNTARRLAWSGFVTMVLGCVFVIVPLLRGNASVLYTFYAPMQASPAFYVGLTLVVVGSWLGGFAVFAQHAWFRRTSNVRVTPLFAFMAVCTMLVWQVATLGVAVEVLFQLVPWSFGWVDTVDVMLSRTLFWFFGHPLVYFWLLPAYMAWYLVMPKLIGGRVFSDNLARMSFLLLIVFSVPVGLHHQLQEPGIDTAFKYVQVVLTLAVVFPSLMTAFSLFATMERAGRARGHRGLFAWARGLPWRDARFVSLFMGMLVFIPGGAGGILLASFNLDQVVHNTMFVTGHFHLTVATAAALTFIGTAYWLVPHAAGRRITPGANRLMLVQVYLWVAGMLTMSTAMHVVGLLGEPRRTRFVDFGKGEDVAASWVPYQVGMAIGGTILFVSVLLAVGLVFHLMLRAPRETVTEPRAEFPLADPPRTGFAVPTWMERWRIWITVLAFLVVAAYAGPVMRLLTDSAPGVRGVKSYLGDEGGTKLPTVTASADEPVATDVKPAADVAGTMVDVELGEDGGKLFLRPSVATVPGGATTFAVKNTGTMPHQLVVLRTDVPAAKLPAGEGGKASEKGRIGGTAELAPGAATVYLTFDELEAGHYVLLCNVPGHYGLGQYAEFTVR